MQTKDIKAEVTLHEDAIGQLWDWFEADRQAKSDIMDYLEECNKMYNCDHWSLKDPTGRTMRTESQKINRPNTVENVIFSLVEGLVAEFSEEVDIIDYPVEEGDDDTATVMSELKKYIMYKNRLKVERERYVRHFFLYGTGIWHLFWDPNWKGGKGPNRWVGDIRWVHAHPQAIYPDLRCRLDIEEGVRVHKARYVTVEYIKEKFGVEVTGDVATDTYVISDDDRYIDHDSEEVLLVETWYKGSPKILDKKEKDEGHGMHVVWWCGETENTYLAHQNYIYYEPEEDPKFPFVFRNRYPREGSVWGYGEAYFLKSPQIVLNKTTELILEGNMHFALGQTFYKPGAITPKQEKFLKKFGTLPNMYFPVNNIDGINRIHGKGVDQSLMTEASRIQRSMESIVGRHDISQGRTPGSVVAFRALDLLAARARVRLRSAENAIISAYEDCGNYVNNLINQFYTEKRAYRILGDNAEKEDLITINMETGEERPFLGEVPPGWTVEIRKEPMVKYGTFQPDEHKKVHVYDNESGYSETLPYDEEMKEAVYQTEMLLESGEEFDTTIDYEVYSPQMDVMCTVSTSAPTDRTFYMEMAKELLINQLISEETFWYVLQNGKFPPYQTIIGKKKKELMAMAQHQQELAMQQPPEGMPQEGMPQEGAPQGEVSHDVMLQQIMADNPAMLDQFNQLSPEAQQQVLANVGEGEMYY